MYPLRRVALGRHPRKILCPAGPHERIVPTSERLVLRAGPGSADPNVTGSFRSRGAPSAANGRFVLGQGSVDLGVVGRFRSAYVREVGLLDGSARPNRLAVVQNRLVIALRGWSCAVQQLLEL